MKAFRFDLDVSSRQDIVVTDAAYSLWLKWNESHDYNDWDAFVDYVIEEVADKMVFYIREASPVS